VQKSDTNQDERVLYIRIEPNAAVPKALNIKILSKILNALDTSFESFIQIEIAKRYLSPKPALKKEIKQLFSETILSITDFDFGRFTLAIAVDDVLENGYRVLKNPSALKEELFALYQNTVFSTDLLNADYVKASIQKYSPKERIRIFQPVYDNLINQNDFNLYFGNSKTAVSQSWLKTDDKELVSSLLPEPVKKAKGELETYYQYVKTGEENDLFGKRSKYKKVLVKETAAPDLYPYQLQKIKVNGKEVSFTRQLTATVSINHNQYHISLPELQIKVQNESRADAEKAFMPI